MRITISLDQKLYDAVIKAQAKLLISKGSGITFSKVVQELLLKGLKK